MDYHFEIGPQMAPAKRTTDVPQLVVGFLASEFECKAQQ
jgi:hypothetical protein